MDGFSRIINYLKQYKSLIYLSIICNILLSVFTVISIPVIIPFFQLLFDRLPKSDPNKTGIEAWLNDQFVSMIDAFGKQTALVYVCLFIVVIFFFKNLFRYLALYFITPVRNGIVRDIRRDLHDKFIALPLSYYSDERKGDLIARATLDVQEVEWSILNVIESLFKAPIIIVGCLIFMLYISVKLSLFVFVLLIFTALIIGGIGRSLRSTSGQAQVKLGKLASTIEETLSGLRIIKAYNAESFQSQKFNHDNETYYNSLNKILKRRDLAAPLSEFLGIGVVAILLWYGTILVFENQLSPETFFAFVFAFYQVIEPSKYFSSAIYNIQKGRSAMDRIESIMAFENTVKDSGDAIEINGFDDKIEFHNVSFKYPVAEDNALNNINLTINKGEKVAFVGPSGGGKSTLMDLLIRFHECSSGEIKIDGIDVNKLKTSSLRSLFGVVTQEAILFNDTIKNNISFGLTPDDVSVEKAASAANAKSFIEEQSQSYEYSIGDKGGKLSGGQKQRITIARAIYKNPPIMILDEATSSLDSQSEKLVQEAIDNIMQERTSLVIAHRLSTIKKADKIVVISNGNIVAMGNHTSLMESSHLYKNLVENQNIEI
jgi:ABC-type multidrug transport system fused ATPase/permease subunit